MRMVSNRHVTGPSMKKFKRIHVQHKVYITKPIEKLEIKADERKKEEEVVKIEEKVVESPAIQEVETEVVTPAPKPRTRKKKAAVVETIENIVTGETIENNEEKSEENG